MLRFGNWHHPKIEKRGLMLPFDDNDDKFLTLGLTRVISSLICCIAMVGCGVISSHLIVRTASLQAIPVVETYCRKGAGEIPLFR
jgi:hypothetical protein